MKKSAYFHTFGAMNIRHLAALTALHLISLCLFHSTVAITHGQDRRPDQGFRAGNSYSISDIESVNQTNGNMMVNIPLASLSGGRGSAPGITVAMHYNSKLWNSSQERLRDIDGLAFYTRELIVPSDQGGWFLDKGFYQLNLVNRLGLQPEATCMEGAEAYQRNAFVFKLEMRLPNGGATEFKPYATGASDWLGDGFFNLDPYGVSYSYAWGPPTGEGGAPTCDQTITQTITSGINYYTDDGSGLRLFLPYQPNVPVSAMRWTMYLPDGRIIEHFPPDDPSVSQRLTDRNGNRVVWRGSVLNGVNGLKIEDETGRFVFVGDNNTVVQPGINGELLETTLQWKDIWVYHSYQTTTDSNADPSLIQAELIENLGALEKIILPPQAGGLEYSFTYHASDTQPTTGNYTNGWGEIASITLPGGARAEYTFSLYGNDPYMLSFDLTANSVLERKLTYTQEYDGQPQQIVEVTSYGISVAGGVGGTCGSDGRCQTQRAAVGGLLNGYAYNISQTGGSTVERIWDPGNSRVAPYVKTEFTSIPDANGNPLLTAIKDFDYDQNGNILEIREYDWVAYSSVPRSTTQPPGEFLPVPRPTGLPAGLVLRRRTINTYYNPTPIATDTTISPNHFADPASPRLHNVIKSTEVRDGAGVIKSRSEFYYDDPSNRGNMTETRVWDSTKGAVTNPLVSGNSVSTFAQYDQYGNVTLATDARGVQTAITYGAVAGPAGGVTGLYATQTVAAANFPTLARTSTAEYDFYTGAVTRAVDADNNVSTVTEYDAVGRPTKVRTAAGTSLESWVRTEYDDVARRVIVRSDIEAMGDGRRVAIQHFDQLGRVRLTRTLENAAAEDPYNETHGIKVQTRYGYDDPTPLDPTDPQNSNGAFTLTSNPYRAATSGLAGGEATMGWTLSYAAKTGRHSSVTTFSGAGLPSPWGSNAATTGVVLTDSDADAVTVTDQAGKKRRSITNSLGQLIRVDEPDAAGNLGTVSSPAQPTVYSYDTLNNLTAVNQGVQTRTFAYDSLSRLLSAVNPESGTISYLYDNNGNLTRKTDARGIQANYTYDALNRVTLRDYSDLTPGVSYTYDNLPNAKGRLTKVSSSVSATEYTAFDILGRVTAHKQTTDGTVYTTGYVYNLSGGLVEETYPSGRKVKNTLEADGDLARVETLKPGGVWAIRADSFSYNAAGAVTSLRLGNNRWESTQFNSRLQPTRITLGTAQNGTDMLKLDYGYGTTDNNGNVQSQTITVPTVGANPGFTAVQSYTYDSLNRLKDAKEMIGATQTWKQTFVFDRYGNRNFDPANTTYPTSFAQPNITNPAVNAANNRFNGGQGWAYDAAGNTTADPNGQTFVYDAENKQVSVSNSGGTIGQYSYDGDGKRVKKVVPSTNETTVFVYDAAGQLVAEYSTQTSQTAGISYLTNDHLGSPRIITDATGTVTSRRDFHPYGEEIFTAERTQGLNYIADTVRQKFTTYERDSETNLDFAHARYFNSDFGRFSIPDDFLNDTHPAAPQSWNLYVYARNNPLFFLDPSGEKIFAGNITDENDRAEFLRRANATYGCSSCVNIGDDGYVTVDTNGLSPDVIDATQFLTDAINSNDPTQLFNVEITNNNSEVAFGDSGTRKGVAITGSDGVVRNISAINIRLDFGDDEFLYGNEELKASLLTFVFAHEVSHFAPKYKKDPTTSGVRGDVDNPVNEIRATLGLPLRVAYQARSIGALAYLKFGVATNDPVAGGFARRGDGIEVFEVPGNLIFFWQRRVKEVR